jgi:hypothetical protein
VSAVPLGLGTPATDSVDAHRGRKGTEACTAAYFTTLLIIIVSLVAQST